MSRGGGRRRGAGRRGPDRGGERRGGPGRRGPRPADDRAGVDDAPGGGWIVGRNAVLEALAGPGGAHRGGGIDRVLLADDEATARWWRAEGGEEAARRAGASVASAPRAALDRIAGDAVHQGVAARRARALLVELDEILGASPAPTLLVLLDGVEDPRNLGAIVRSAAAAGADAVLVPERRSAGPGPGAAKAAAGALERIPLARVKNVQRALEAMHEAGLWSLGLDAAGPSPWRPDGTAHFDLKRRTCLVVGAEDRGLSRLARERCDDLVGLPLSRGVESLNASVAAAVLLYEVVRQRTSS